MIQQQNKTSISSINNEICNSNTVSNKYLKTEGSQIIEESETAYLMSRTNSSEGKEETIET